MMTAERYRRIAAWFYGRVWAYRLLFCAVRFLPLLFYGLYPALLAALLFAQDARFPRVVFVPFAAFALCTILRKAVKARRPYEKLDIEPLIYGRGRRDSFPSRHVTCAAVIAAACGYMVPAAGVVLGVAALGIAVTRVLAGIHFPRDVLAGGLLGAACGWIGFVLL